MATSTYTIGIDYGTNSVRAVVVNTTDGSVVGTRVFDYPSGDHGVLLDAKQPHLARQNPADYIEGLRVAVGGLRTARDSGVWLGDAMSVAAGSIDVTPD